MEIPIRMPEVSTTDSGVKIVKWLVSLGQTVRRGQPILEVETDKAVMEVESHADGVVKSILAPVDAVVETGQVVAILQSEAGA